MKCRKPNPQISCRGAAPLRPSLANYVAQHSEPNKAHRAGSHYKEFLRAIFPNTAPLGFTVLLCVDKSTATIPNFGSNPDIHSKLSSNDHVTYPRTSTPSSIARFKPVSAR